MVVQGHRNAVERCSRQDSPFDFFYTPFPSQSKTRRASPGQKFDVRLDWVGDTWNDFQFPSVFWHPSHSSGSQCRRGWPERFCDSGIGSWYSDIPSWCLIRRKIMYSHSPMNDIVDSNSFYMRRLNRSVRNKIYIVGLFSISSIIMSCLPVMCPFSLGGNWVSRRKRWFPRDDGARCPSRGLEKYIPKPKSWGDDT